MPKTSSFSRAMALAMVVGAARADAAEQGKFDDLKAQALPLLAQFRKDGDTKPLLAAIRRVLGEDWVPQGEWSEMLQKLMEDNDVQ